MNSRISLTTLDRVAVDDVVAGLLVREFRWYKGRRHYSGWYWSLTMAGLVAYESRLELARICWVRNEPGDGVAAHRRWLAWSTRLRRRRGLYRQGFSQVSWA